MRNLFTSEPSEVSARMSLIRGRNTKPELALFLALRNANIPFESHVRIGKVEVDAVVEGQLLIFVDSPFWHLRNDLLLERLSPYWKNRLLKNRARDRRTRRNLRQHGYSTLRLWADAIDEKKTIARISRAMARLHHLTPR